MASLAIGHIGWLSSCGQNKGREIRVVTRRERETVHVCGCGVLCFCSRRSRCLTYLVRREFKQRAKRLREQMMSPSAGGSTVHPLLQKVRTPRTPGTRPSFSHSFSHHFLCQVLSDLTVLDDFISALCRFFKLVDLPKATQPPASSSADTPSPCYSPPFPHTYGRASQPPPPPPPRAARPSQGCRCLMEAQGIDQDISRTTSTTTTSSRAAGTCGMAGAGMTGELTEAEMTPQIDPRWVRLARGNEWRDRDLAVAVPVCVCVCVCVSG